ncbi:MAG TPA: cytochrome c peroxidase [Gemmatimonadales bacterium]|jgi:cytochrome c peroxidase
MIVARVRALRRLTIAALGVGVIRCSSRDAPGQTGVNPHPIVLVRPAAAPLSPIARLGREIFFDPALSGSGTMACASCHDPAHAYGPPNDRAVQLGGRTRRDEGTRVVPSLRYLDRVPPFGIGAENEAAENSNAATLAMHVTTGIRTPKAAGSAAGVALVPRGGLFWDGRASTLEAQAAIPLFNHAEMAGGSVASVAAHLRRAPYITELRRAFGAGAIATSQRLIDEALFAVTRFEIEDPSFHPYSSKYDAYLEGRAFLTPTEARGLSAFEDSTKGNCAACHLDRPGANGEPPLFTDFEYEALGVPRNESLAANRNPGYFDLGLCGPARSDLVTATGYCGMFRTPSLRNVATRKVFFHNGVYRSLAEVLRFYDLRGPTPNAIYRRDTVGVAQSNDIPAALRGNIDTIDAPFNHRIGSRPAMTEGEMRDIIAFLGTLTDGYQVPPLRPR